jgi:hypothetical protein
MRPDAPQMPITDDGKVPVDREMLSAARRRASHALRRTGPAHSAGAHEG